VRAYLRSAIGVRALFASVAAALHRAAGVVAATYSRLLAAAAGGKVGVEGSGSSESAEESKNGDGEMHLEVDFCLFRTVC
jgi:hypothetical protein